MKLAALNLSDNEIKALEAQYKQERDRRIAERIHCIILYAQGHSLKELKRILFVGIKTLAQWIKTFIKLGIAGLRKWGYTGQVCHLSDAQWAEVEEELDKGIYHTARQVAEFVKERFGIKYTERGMQALLRRKGYRHIKTRLVPGKSPKPEVQQDFITLYHELKEALGPQDRIYFVDAVHMVHNVRISYVWTKKGCRKRVRSNSGRKRYNVLGAYCAQDGEYVDVRSTGNVNAETVKALVDKIRALHPEADCLIFILDNARYQHAQLVQEHLIHNTDNVVFWFLPPYCPNLNLIERLWRFLKEEVADDRYHSTFEEFVQAIDKVLDNLGDYADQLKTLMTQKFEIVLAA